MGIRREDLDPTSGMRGTWPLRRSVFFIAAFCLLFWLAIAGIGGWLFDRDVENASIVALGKGPPGSRLSHTIAPGMELVIEFDPREAAITREGAHLVLHFDNGAHLELRNFVAAARSSSPPALRDRNDHLLPGDLVLELIEARGRSARFDEALDIQTAAGR
ncbi:MAG: hypothetical protein KIT20_09100 [Alphaproteobacteria bacterium]|nr:hypothetical protein [Alphaproteobacteria bacterium]